MPIYEYFCTDCGSEIEVIQKFNDAPLESCSSCAGKLQKKISASTFHLKGSGWYVTDYARKPSGTNGNDGKASKETSTSDSKVAENAPAKAESGMGDSAKSDTSSTT